MYSCIFTSMKRYFFFALFVLLLTLSSCVDTKPFRVGDNIDSDWHIINLKSTSKVLDNAANRICFSNKAMKNVAVGYFVSSDFHSLYEGRILAERLQDKLVAQCGLSTYIVDTYKYLDTKDYGKIIKRPNRQYEFLVYGNYIYMNKGYDLNVVVEDLNRLKPLKTWRYRIPLRSFSIEINTLHIPQEIDLQ